MKEFFDKVLTWVKSNVLLSIIGLIAVIVIFFPKLFKGIFRTRPHADQWYTRAARERRKERKRPGRVLRSGVNGPKAGARRGRFLPRSVGMRKAGRTNRIIKSGVNRGKKAWQIKGSPEARRHMANIRRKRK